MRVPPSERGAALLTVLLLVAVMAVLAAAALERLKLATHLTSNGGAIEQARSYALAAENVARFRIGDLIQRDAARTTLEGDWAGRPTNFPIDGGIATARLDDGGNCFNLNSLVDQGQDGVLIARPIAMVQFARLMTLLEIPERDASPIAAAAADWIDSDSNTLPGGAEDAAYMSRERTLRTANTLMADASELRVVAGMTPPYYARVRPYVCALPVTDLSVINVNTLRLDQTVLLSMLLPGLDAPRARQAIDARPMRGWDSLTTFWGLPPLTAIPPVTDARNQIRLATRWFDLRLNIELADAEFQETALIDAAQKPAKVVRRSYGDAS
jgi:general secretion pathway protein K